MRLKRSGPARNSDRTTASEGGYDAWAAYLDRWGEGEPADGTGLPPLVPEDFRGDTWARLANRFTGAIGRRLEGWQTALVRATDAAGSDEFAFGRALQQSRVGLHSIRALAGDERLPEELRTQLTGLVDGKLRDMQRQLEDSVQRQRDRGDSARFVEARLVTLRTNALTAVTTEAQRGIPAWTPPAEDGVPRKRIIHP